MAEQGSVSTPGSGPQPTPNHPSVTPRYEDLSPEAIRLLILLPSHDRQSDIEIRLCPVKLQDAPDYEAISYTWATEAGDVALSGSVFLPGGAEIKVTRNCEHMLRRLRRTDADRVMWVDAICINQADAAERTRQVAMMGDIYTAATKVSIWLGDASTSVDPETGLSTSSVFFRYLNPMAAELQASWERGDYPWISDRYTRLAEQVAAYVTSGEQTLLVKGFLDVVLRPWWERVWVVQEAALSEAVTVVCGKDSVQYHELYLLAHQIITDTTHESGLTLSCLEGFKQHMYCILFARVWFDHYGPAKTIRWVLSTSRRLQATDKRDHIFALRDIFGDSKTELPIADYSKTTLEVYIDITSRLLRLMDSLDVLLQASNVDDEDDGNRTDWPSFVPDWSQRPQFHIPASDGLYHASGGSTPSYTFLDGGKELRLQGMFVDVLEYLPKADPAAYRNPYVPAKGLLGYQQSCRVGLSLKTYPTGEDIKEVLWRTLCWNVDAQVQHPADSKLAGFFDKFYGIITSGNDMSVMEREVLEEAAGFNDICVHSMPLGITAKGYLASVPWTARAGDCIAIFAGGELPFVLRKSGRGEYYRLMGACYVHGIMGGEAFASDPRHQVWISVR